MTGADSNSRSPAGQGPSFTAMSKSQSTHFHGQSSNQAGLNVTQSVLNNDHDDQVFNIMLKAASSECLQPACHKIYVGKEPLDQQPETQEKKAALDGPGLHGPIPYESHWHAQLPVPSASMQCTTGRNHGSLYQHSTGVVPHHVHPVVKSDMLSEESSSSVADNKGAQSPATIREKWALSSLDGSIITGESSMVFSIESTGESEWWGDESSYGSSSSTPLTYAATSTVLDITESSQVISQQASSPILHGMDHMPLRRNMRPTYNGMSTRSKGSACYMSLHTSVARGAFGASIDQQSVQTTASSKMAQPQPSTVTSLQSDHTSSYRSCSSTPPHSYATQYQYRTTYQFLERSRYNPAPYDQVVVSEQYNLHQFTHVQGRTYMHEEKKANVSIGKNIKGRSVTTM